MTVHRVDLSKDDVANDFRRNVGELLRHDGDRGIVLWGPSADPVMLLWSPRIYEFLQVLESVVSYAPARGMCREVGFRSGYDGARAAPQALGLPDGETLPALLAMPRILAGAGWGVSGLVYDDAAGSVTWTFPRGTAVGIAASRQGRRTNPACAFFEGFASGWAKGSVGLHVEFFETRCLALGHPECRFESRPLG